MSEKTKHASFSRGSVMDFVLVGTGGCWNWNRGIFRDGYGGIYLKGKMCAAHREMWKLFNGQIPPGLFVLHRCDNPICVNPSHLFLGTHIDNKRDAMKKRRHSYGERNAHVLTEEQVLLIRKLKRSNNLPLSHIAKRFGVSVGCIRSVVTGHTWKHLPIFK